MRKYQRTTIALIKSCPEWPFDSFAVRTAYLAVVKDFLSLCAINHN